MADQFSGDTMLDLFVFETTQLIEKLEEILLTNEKTSGYSEEAISEIFRIMHTIKGSSAMMMFENITTLAHAMEDLFYYIREEKPNNINFTALTDIVLACLDFFQAELEKIKIGSVPDGEYAGLIRRINNFLQIIGHEDGSADVIKDGTNFNPIYNIISEKSVSDGMNCFKAVIFFDEGIMMENIHAYSIIHNLKKSQNEVFYIPSDIAENNESVEIIRKDGFKIYIKTVYPYETIHQLLSQAVFVREIELKQLENEDEIRRLFYLQEEQTVQKESTVPAEGQKQDVNNSAAKELLMVSGQPSIISVNVNKLDKLMDLVGEIVIAEAMVIQNSDLKGLVLNDFNKSAGHLKKITDELQDTVMAIRMVPLTASFHKMNRLVRDMSKKLNKEVKLELLGEETEVDKNIIEHISDPLMHLVRNAMDHGVESPDERTRKGKSQTGTISLEAKSSGSDVLIIIRDDGRGLDKESILQKARENNLIVRSETEMSDRDIFNLILLPGFSTNDTVTEFSGRGVGMDVVIKNIEMVGGSVLVDSVQEQGTEITLKIPLTLAIIDGMNIRVGSSHYTIPTISVKEFFRPNIRNIITDPNGNEMIMVRGLCYPILRLYELYGVKGAETKFDCGIIIMVEQEGKTICIFADELLGQQQVVVKTLPDYIRKKKKITGLIGCTLLGDGSISLILDVAGLISKSNKSK